MISIPHLESRCLINFIKFCKIHGSRHQLCRNLMIESIKVLDFCRHIVIGNT